MIYRSHLLYYCKFNGKSLFTALDPVISPSLLSWFHMSRMSISLNNIFNGLKAGTFKNIVWVYQTRAPPLSHTPTRFPIKWMCWRCVIECDALCAVVLSYGIACWQVQVSARVLESQVRWWCHVRSFLCCHDVSWVFFHHNVCYTCCFLSHRIVTSSSIYATMIFVSFNIQIFEALAACMTLFSQSSSPPPASSARLWPETPLKWFVTISFKKINSLIWK